MTARITRKFTGWHMAGILVGFFGLVAAVNFTMAAYASSTFGGIVVENSYVASQKYNGWLDEAERQQALGWQLAPTWREDGHLQVAATGPGEGAALAAIARHPLGRMPDRAMAFDRQPDGSFLSQEALPAGRWTIRYELSEGEARWRHEEDLR